MLLRAKVIPQTPASDLLRITLRVISRNREVRTVAVYQGGSPVAGEVAAVESRE